MTKTTLILLYIDFNFVALLCVRK